MIRYDYDDLKDALEAIVWARATEEAYEVAARFGWYELFPGAIYREENWMNVKTAREILARAKKDEIFDGDIPSDDSDALEKAGEIITLAEQAWESHVRGPEVEAILNLAKADQNGGAPENSDNELEAESSDEEKPTEVFVFKNLPENLSKSEPWEGYNDATVEEVTEGINWFGTDSPDDILDILKNVWAFESAHKDRKRILNFVKEAFVKFGGDLGTETTEEEGTEEEISEEPDGDEGIDSSGSGEGDEQDPEGISEEETESSESKSDAGDDAKPEKSAPSSEGKSSEVKSTPKDSESGSGGGAGGASAEKKLVGLVDKQLAAERLDGIPKRPEQEAPDLPWNWNDISDQQLHDLHMQYASLAYYKAFQRARNERIGLHAKEAADELRNKLLIEAPKYDDKNKEIKVTVLDAQINSDENVRRWRKMQNKYERFAMQAKHELESLHKIVEALSRLETMRHNAFERGRK